jgi:RHS repeat-associated protein
LYFNGATATTPNGTTKARLEIIGQVSTSGGPEVPTHSNDPNVTNPYPRDANNVVWVDSPQYGFRLVYPDGSQDVYGFVVEWGSHICPYPSGDPRCASGGSGTNTTAGALDYTSRAYLTQRIDPQGRKTRLGYQYTGQASPRYYVRYVVDPDGRTNTYYTNYLSQVQYLIDAWGRTNSLTYFGGGQEGLLAGITDGAGLTSWFQYQAPVVGATNWSYGYSNAWPSTITYCSGWITNLTTPYGTTAFTWLQNPATNQFDAFTQRALLATEPGGAHQLYYYRHNGSGLLPGQDTSVPVVPGYSFDAGTNGSSAPQLYYRNSLHWDRRQFAALSSGVLSVLVPLYPPPGGMDLGSGLASLTANDYGKASLQHWLLGSDGVSISGSVSSQRDPSPDAQGQTEGARTWYDYARKDPNNPQMEGGEVLPGCIARVLPDGTTGYVCLDYGTEDSPFPLTHWESYTQTDGSLGVRTNWYHYSTNGVDLLAFTNAAGQYVNLGYNTNHQVTLVTNALGEASQVGYDSWTRNLTSLSLRGGQTATLSYYAPGSPPTGSTNSLLQSITVQPQNLTNQIADYTGGLPRVVQTSGTGLPALTVTNFWDGLNRLTGTAFPDGTTVSNTYDRLYLGATKDRLGHWTRYGYDALQHLTSITDARSNLTQFGWCDCGALSTITNALTNVTSLSYNNQGLLINILFADNSSVTYTPDTIGRVTGVADGLGKALTFGYNNQGLATVVSNAYGPVESIVYDAADRPAQVTDANNVTVTSQFDRLNRLIAQSWPDGIGEGFGWATNGLVAYTNRNQKVTGFTRDGAGRLTYVTNANQEVTQVGYNALGQVTDLWDGRRTNHTVWHYDQYGWLSNKVDALGHEILRYTRDPNGQISIRWTPQFGTNGYGYDEVGNLKSIAYPLSSISYAYDALNRLKTMVDDSGTTTFGYTAAGQLQTADGPWTSDTVTYGYTQGQRTSLSLGSLNFGYGYDSAWRLYTLTSPAGSFNYAYDAQRPTLPTTLTLPNSAWITNHYDSLERLDYTAVVNRWGHVLDGYGYGYDYLGLRTGITRDLGLTNSSVTVGYDSVGQITSWQAREDLTGPLRLNEQLGWVYDAAGNLRYRTNGGLIQTFTTDPVDQLTNVARNNTMTVSGATPAPAASVTVNGTSAQRYGDFTFAATNQGVSSGQNTFTIVAQKTGDGSVTNNLVVNLPASVTLLFDSNGNLTNDGTRSFAYSPENQLTNITVAGAWKSDFVFDGLGRRRVELDYGWQGGNWVKTNEWHFVYDGGLLAQMRDGSNNVLVTYTRGLDLSGSLAGAGGIGGLLARTDGNGSTFFHADGAGNITALMDAQGSMAARYLYGAFGKLTGQWGRLADVNTMQFSSMPVHRLSGLVHFHGREYDTTPQRWLQRDPIGEAGGINLYGFVRNNPLRYADPWGFGLYTGGEAFARPDNSGLSNEQLANVTENDMFGPPTFANMSAGYDPLAAGAPGSISFGGGGGFAVGGYSSPALVPGLQDIAGDLALMVAIGMVTDGLGDLFLPEAEELLAAKRLSRCAPKATAAITQPVVEGFGNIGGGATTAENALGRAQKWLGQGYKEIAPGVYRSADNTLQFRMTVSDLTDLKQGPHVHFEAIGPDGHTIIENSHVGISNP